MQKLIYSMFNHTDILGWYNLCNPFSQYLAWKNNSRFLDNRQDLEHWQIRCETALLFDSSTEERSLPPQQKKQQVCILCLQSQCCYRASNMDLLGCFVKTLIPLTYTQKKENPCWGKAIINRSLFSTDEYPEMKRLRLPTSLWSSAK